MSIKAINFKFNGPTTAITSYDSTVTNIGTLIKQYSGATNEDVFAGPAKIGLARPMEASTAIPGIYPHVITYNSDIDYVFLADNATAAATRRFVFYTYYKNTSTFVWNGFITVTFPTATNHTIRGFRVIKEVYSVGTISGSGTSITGSGTTWTTDRLCVGSRIGFGSQNPELISTWYEITAIGSNTGITVDSSVGTINSGTDYIIEDLRIVVSTTNATTTNGGLFLIKGLRLENFTIAGTNISAAASTDNVRACYWLADASTVTNTTAGGAAIEEKDSWTSQNVYVLNATGSKVFVYNFRKNLTLSSGKDTTSLVLSTGNQAVSGTLSQTNNGRVGILSHGPGAGIESLYYVTSTRVYRSSLSAITNGSITWQSDVMIEVPPGSASTYPATGALTAVEIAGDVDRLVITSTGTAGARSYVSEYNTNSTPFNHIFLADDKQYDQSLADSNSVIHPAINASPMAAWSQNGILYLARVATTPALNQIYTIPIGAHQTYAQTNNQMLITPKIDISDSNKLYNFIVNSISRLGSDTLSLSTESFRKYYRTSGIVDNTGTWILLDDTGDLTGVSGTEIQFMFAFRILGTSCIPARIFGFALIYEDNTTDSHYEPSVGNSSVVNRIFSYRQKSAWGSNIPHMRIRIYNAVSGALILDDDTNSNSFGSFEYSIDGGSSWASWDSSQDNTSNYIRYAASSLPSSIRVRALLTQL